MKNFKEIINNPKIIDEYEKAFLLNLFQKLCSKMEKNHEFKQKIKTLYNQTFNKDKTTQVVFKKFLNYSLESEKATMISKWLTAYFSKNNKRMRFSNEYKKKMIKSQNGVCAICGEKLGNDLSKVHIDHIIPWKLVGDELKNNYQALCSTCNECKNDKTDFIFKELMELN